MNLSACYNVFVTPESELAGLPRTCRQAQSPSARVFPALVGGSNARLLGSAPFGNKCLIHS